MWTRSLQGGRWKRCHRGVLLFRCLTMIFLSFQMLEVGCHVRFLSHSSFSSSSLNPTCNTFSILPCQVELPSDYYLSFSFSPAFLHFGLHHCLPSHYPLLLISSTSWTVSWGCPFYLALACCQPSMSRGARGAKQTKLFTFYFQQDCRQMLLPLITTNRGNKKGWNVVHTCCWWWWLWL